MNGILRRMTRRIRAVVALLVRSLAWSAVAVAAAIAAGGLVLALDHAGSEVERPELFFRGAALVGPRLESLDPALEAMAAAAERLSGGGREALGWLRSADGAGATVALAEGQAALRELSAAGELVAAGRTTLLDGLGAIRLPATDREQVEAIGAALAAAKDLPPMWHRVETATALPFVVLASIDAHERLVVDATVLGRDGEYAEALSTLGRSDAALAAVRAVREDAFADGREVAALDERIARWSDYRDALAELYGRLVANGGVHDAGVAVALDAVDLARAALPGDDALAAIGMDLGGSDIMPALLDMEGARGIIERAALGPPDPDTVELG